MLPLDLAEVECRSRIERFLAEAEHDQLVDQLRETRVAEGRNRLRVTLAARLYALSVRLDPSLERRGLRSPLPVSR